MNITPVNTTNQNKPAFGMKLKFATADARKLFQELIPFDEYKKVLPEIESLKDKNGKEIIVIVSNNRIEEDCLCFNNSKYFDTDNIPSMALMSKLKYIAEAVNDALTTKEYTKLISPPRTKKLKV